MRDPFLPDPGSDGNSEMASLVIIDDDGVVRDVLRRLVEIADPQAALAWCRTHTPDVLLYCSLLTAHFSTSCAPPADTPTLN
jgi:hypothetical protein